jgi:short-subunit dehydrogenase
VAAKEQGGALIVGASSGIGEALARRLAAEGYRVALVARRQEPLDALAAELNARAAGSPVAFAYAHDVTAHDEAPALFARIARDVAPLRLAIYASGIMPRRVTGESFDDEWAMIETNVVGALQWLGLAADVFERQRAGVIVGLSSVAGDRGRPGNGAYQASKAALSSYLDSLRFRLKPAGVRVVTIKPGYVATPMTAGLPLPKPLTLSPDAAAARIVRASEHANGVAYIPSYWRAIMWLVRRMPAVLVARMPG